MKPFLSVLIPTYNRADMTIECAKSVGDNPDVEIVIVDDCSNDTEFAKLLDADIPNAKLYRNDANLGMTKNFNRCMELASGDWFGLIGSDDYYKPGAIDRAINALHCLPPCLMVYARSTKARLLQPGVETVRNMKLPSGSGNFWHRSIYEDLGGFDERLTFSPDLEYWYRIASKYPVAESREKFSVYREHGNNLMYDTWRKRDEFLRHIKLITRLNMVHRGEDVTDLDAVVANESKAVWDVIVYIIGVVAKKPDKKDIYWMYMEKAKSMAFTRDRIDTVERLRNKHGEDNISV